MTPDVRKTVLAILGRIAPEADLDRLDPEVNFREELDLDSMDFLRFVEALHKELGVTVPEKDYPKLTTLRGCLAYLAAAPRESTSGRPTP
jgi:acyl carrier protein